MTWANKGLQMAFDDLNNLVGGNNFSLPRNMSLIAVNTSVRTSKFGNKNRNVVVSHSNEGIKKRCEILVHTA